jgi:hypothetical protein
VHVTAGDLDRLVAGLTQHRLSAAAMNTDALLVHCPASRPSPQFDFGGRGMDERFNVKEAIHKYGEPTTKIARATPQPHTVFICQKRNTVEYVVMHLDMILDQGRIFTFE